MMGARMHYAVPRLLHEAGLLDRFFTDSYIGNKPWLEATLCAIPGHFRPSEVMRWLGRKDKTLPPGKVTSFEVMGLWYAFARRNAKTLAQSSEVSREAARRFNRNILKKGLGDAPVVWGFNGAALELLMAAKHEGRVCVLEQTILPRALEQRLLVEEQQRWPGWELHPSDWTQPTALDGREEAEWDLADAIVAGSTFVQNGLIEMGVPREKIHVIPYGVDSSYFGSDAGSDPYVPGNRPLRVLFAGAVGLRKGVPDLLHALPSIVPGQIEMRIVGRIELAEDKLTPFRSFASFLGPVPRPLMRDLFQWADVFVLPSLVEGSATVTYEAIMSGCPVITTENSGTLIQNGVDGFIVPIRSPERLSTALQAYVDEPSLLTKHRVELYHTRKQASLTRYKADLITLIKSFDITK